MGRPSSPSTIIAVIAALSHALAVASALCSCEPEEARRIIIDALKSALRRLGAK